MQFEAALTRRENGGRGILQCGGVLTRFEGRADLAVLKGPTAKPQKLLRFLT